MGKFCLQVYIVAKEPKIRIFIIIFSALQRFVLPPVDNRQYRHYENVLYCRYCRIVDKGDSYRVFSQMPCRQPHAVDVTRSLSTLSTISVWGGGGESLTTSTCRPFAYLSFHTREMDRGWGYCPASGMLVVSTQIHTRNCPHGFSVPVVKVCGRLPTASRATKARFH
jgi:hypothetical protein